MGLELGELWRLETTAMLTRRSNALSFLKFLINFILLFYESSRNFTVEVIIGDGITTQPCIFPLTHTPSLYIK